VQPQALLGAYGGYRPVERPLDLILLQLILGREWEAPQVLEVPELLRWTPDAPNLRL